MRIGLFAGQEVGHAVTAFLYAQGAAPECLVLDAADPGGWNQRITDAAPGVPTVSSEELGTIGLEQLRALGLDLLILAWWPYILKPPVIDLPRLGCLNFHPSLLPHNRGKHPNFWALVEGRPFGVTLMWVDPGVDTGSVAFQRELPIGWEDTGATLHTRAREAMVDLFRESWPRIRAGDIPREPQPEGGSFHRAAEIDAASEIGLDRVYSARELLDLIRARTYPPHPGAWFVDDGERYEVRLQITRAQPRKSG